MDEEGPIAVHHDRQTGRDFEWIELLVRGGLGEEFFEGFEEFGVVLSRSCLDKTVFEPLDTSGVDLLGRRHSHRFDHIACGSIDLAKETSLLG